MSDLVVTDCDLQQAELARQIRASAAAKAVDSEFGEVFVTAADMQKDLNTTSGLIQDGYLITILRELVAKGKGVDIPSGIAQYKEVLETHQSVAFERGDLDVHTVPFFGNEPGKPLDALYEEDEVHAIVHDSGIAPERLMTYQTDEYLVLLANMFDRGPGGLPDDIDAATIFPNDSRIHFTNDSMRAFGFQDLDLVMECKDDSFLLQMTYKGEKMTFKTPTTKKTDNKYFAGNPTKNAAIKRLLQEIRKYRTKDKPLAAKLTKEVEKYLICKELGDLLILLLAVVYARCNWTRLTAFSLDGVFCARLLEYAKGLDVAVVRQIGKDNGAYRVVHYSNPQTTDEAELERRILRANKTASIEHNKLVIFDLKELLAVNMKLKQSVKDDFRRIRGIIETANASILDATDNKAITAYKAINFFTSSGRLAKSIDYLFVNEPETRELNARFRSILHTIDPITRLQLTPVPTKPKQWGISGSFLKGGGTNILVPGGENVPIQRGKRKIENIGMNAPEAKIARPDDTADLMDILTNMDTYLKMGDSAVDAEFDRIIQEIAEIPVEEVVEQDPTSMVRQLISRLPRELFRSEDEEYVDVYMNMLEPYFNHFTIAIGPGGESFYYELFAFLKTKHPSYTLMNLPELTLDEFQRVLGTRLEKMDRYGTRVRTKAPPGGEVGGGARKTRMRTHRQKRKVTRRKRVKTRGRR